MKRKKNVVEDEVAHEVKRNFLNATWDIHAISQKLHKLEFDELVKAARGSKVRSSTPPHVFSARSTEIDEKSSPVRTSSSSPDDDTIVLDSEEE